jgi:hypothetical protein
MLCVRPEGTAPRLPVKADLFQRMILGRANPWVPYSRRSFRMGVGSRRCSPPELPLSILGVVDPQPRRKHDRRQIPPPRVSENGDRRCHRKRKRRPLRTPGPLAPQAGPTAARSRCGVGVARSRPSVGKRAPRSPHCLSARGAARGRRSTSSRAGAGSARPRDRPGASGRGPRRPTVRGQATCVVRDVVLDAVARDVACAAVPLLGAPRPGRQADEQHTPRGG